MAGLKIINSGKDHWGTRPLRELADPVSEGHTRPGSATVVWFLFTASAEPSTRDTHTQKKKETQTGLWKEAALP